MVELTTEMRRVSASRYNNGERLTAEVIERGADEIIRLQRIIVGLRKRLVRLSAAKD